MPNIESAKKRMRQNEKRRIHNKDIKSDVKTSVKILTTHIEKGETDEAKILLPKVISKLDKAWQKGIFHKNYVARRKSSLNRKFNVSVAK